MATAIVMPKLGLTMTEGEVSQWQVPDGGAVEPGVPLFEVTTEKINYQVEAPEGGVLQVVVPLGQKVPVGTVIGYLLAPGEAVAGGAGAPAATASLPSPAIPGGGSRPHEGARGGDEFIKASPRARRVAEELGVDLAQVTGSGPGGRILEDDVLACHDARMAARPEPTMAPPVAGPPAAMPAAPSPPPAPAPAPVVASSLPYSGLRRTIGERMHGSLQEMAQLTVTMEVDMTGVIALRATLLREWESDGVRVGYNDFIIKAAATALMRHPRLNATLEKDAGRIVLHSAAHVGLAVALDEGLIVPVVRHADAKGLGQIARETADLAARARSNQLAIDEVTGGTFSITALGMYNVEIFTPVVNPPQAAILGVGRISERPVIADGEVVARQRCWLSLSFDHRVVDGAPAAEFLNTIRELLERPHRLLL